MTEEDLFCCPSITGQVISIRIKTLLCSDKWLGKLLLALSDAGQKISEVIYLFAERANNKSESSFNMPIDF